MEDLNKKNKSLLMKAWSAIYKGFLVFLVIIAGVMVLSNLNIPGNIKLFTVQSGSMEPAINMGALIIVKPMGEYGVGDIINISEPANPGVSVTHRIIDIEVTDGQVFFITKGDANESADSEQRLAEDVLGKVIFSIPVLGYLINFTRTMEGLLLLIIIPAVLITIREIINIGRELKKVRKKPKTKETDKPKSKVVKTGKTIWIICMAASVGILGTQAYFTDIEASTSNTISAGTWGIQDQKKQIIKSIKFEPPVLLETTPENDYEPEPETELIPVPSPTVEPEEETPIIIFSVTLTPTPKIELNPENPNNLEE